jgi:hypothetical protein
MEDGGCVTVSAAFNGMKARNQSSTLRLRPEGKPKMGELTRVIQMNRRARGECRENRKNVKKQVCTVRKQEKSEIGCNYSSLPYLCVLCVLCGE